MSRRLFHMIMAVLGLCSGTACSSDAEECRRVSTAQKGISIINGKKVMTK